jgi:tetratricopeptide (TPR) repeat protein
MRIYSPSMSITAGLSLLLLGCGAADRPASAPAPATAAPPATTAAPAAAPAADKEERFDLIVRDDFFAGLLQQDAAALDRGMKICEETLARDPDHSEAMVWHGGGLIMKAGNAFRTGDRATGGKLWTQGLAEMDRAVEIAPESIGTRIPRGAVLLAVAGFAPEPHRTSLLDKGIGDYEKVLALQKDEFDSLNKHARSQLLYGLADGWHRRGDTAKARGYYERLAVAAGDSPYGERARAYLAGDTKPRKMACGGCHAE